MKMKYLPLALGAFALTTAACSNSSSNKDHQDAAQEEVYEAQLQPLNANVTGSETTGEARFVIANDTMTVTIDVKNAPPGMEHWQHFHGFTNDSAATGATMAQDANGDGIVDVVETEAVSGTTMLPFNKLPAAMEVGSDTYPVADDAGAYHYEAKIPMDALNKAFADAFGGSALNLDRRVLYIHGVPDSTQLPETVASIANIPAQVTLPIVCGKSNKVQ